MASSKKASDQSSFEQSTLMDACVLAERPYQKRSGALRQRTSGALLFASALAAVITVGASTKTLSAGPNPRAACAAQDLSALDVIVERSEVIGTSTLQVIEATRRFLLARKLCLSGQKDEGIALYGNAINTAFGFDLPVVNEKGRAAAAAVLGVAQLSR
jgi:hypothetical protein